MKYKITLNGKTYEVEVEEGQAMLVDGTATSASRPAASAMRSGVNALTAACNSTRPVT